MRAVPQIMMLSALGLLLSSCSIRHMAIKSVANGISGESANIFASDDVPELVRDAIPFVLKFNESLLMELPNHKGLLLATARAFTQYAYAFLQLEADFLDEADRSRADKLRHQAQISVRGQVYD
jgi:hypothetical protein